jgi:phosphatidylserine/phosphatidylglycerophosphate/cardiolipin synthase-like enzyme
MKKMIELYSSPWRKNFEDFIKGVSADLLIASPFNKTPEASWICNALNGRSVRLRVLTNLRSDSVLAGSLDVAALKLFSNAVQDSKAIAVPRLHAKVYVRDCDLTIITSANLTPSGLDLNYEYGVGLRDKKLISRIRNDIEAYGRVGSAISDELLTEISSDSEELIDEFKQIQRSIKSKLRKKFNQKLRKIDTEFLRAQIGNRSAHSLFADAIIYVLSRGALPTSELHPRIQKLLPELCNDDVELVIDGQRFGKRWKHDVRNAQQFLKRQKLIGFNGKLWHLIEPNLSSN